jgi:C4-dicarboxylate-specific signal transduction histidine kinase
VLDELGAAVSVAPLAPKSSIDEPLLFANRQYRAVFGTSARGHRELLTGGPAGSDWVAREVYVPRAERWFEVRSRRIVWVDGDPVRLVVANDITAARHARELQEQQVEQLQQTSRLVTMGEMASSIAHELNQPLSAISNYASGLTARLKRNAGAPGVGPEVLDALDKTARQAQRAAAVIRRIRAFVKRSEPERRRVRVVSIVADALGLAKIAAKRNRVAIVTRIAPNLPDLMADPILIEQVLINLLKNGIDAMHHQPRRELTLTVAAVDGQIQFSVSDQGPGLRPDLEDRLFEPFYTTKPDGMGIGLNICRSIVESHGGRLWVEANVPSGCVFRFVLPVSLAREALPAPVGATPGAI